MIEVEFAQKFIEQVTKYTEYNINIMNEKGIIIASRDSARVGTFHSIAYQIVHGTDDFVVTTIEDNYPGVLPGINQVIVLDGVREGCVGITGNPDEVKPIALITKMAVEAMLRYEVQENLNNLRRSRKEHFFNLLTQVEFANQSELRMLAKDLHYSESIVRVPILCKIPDSVEISAERLLKSIKSSQFHSPEDLSSVIDESHILIFKTLPDHDIFSNYRHIVLEYIEGAIKRVAEKESFDISTHHCICYVGSFQSSFSLYYYGYQHCKWLESTLGTMITKRIHFFYDYQHSFMEHILPHSELHRVFNVFNAQLDERFKMLFCEVAEALIYANYNLVTAALYLNIHKNTFIYRLNKVRENLHIDPIESSKDRIFMEALYFTLHKSL